MLFVIGVSLLVVGTIVTAAAGMIFQDHMGPVGLRRLLNSQALSVILAMFMGSGLMILFLFIVEFSNQTFGMAEMLVTFAVLAVGAVAVRSIAVRHRQHHEHDRDHAHFPPAHPA
jgi:hypothetical protein